MDRGNDQRFVLLFCNMVGLQEGASLCWLHKLLSPTAKLELNVTIPEMHVIVSPVYDLCENRFALLVCH